MWRRPYLPYIAVPIVCRTAHLQINYILSGILLFDILKRTDTVGNKEPYYLLCPRQCSLSMDVISRWYLPIMFVQNQKYTYC